MNDPRLTRQAADDLGRICFDLYARDRDQSASVDTVLAAILARCWALAQDPEAAPSRDSEVSGIRVTSCVALDLYFRTTPDTIELIRVFGASGPFLPIPNTSADQDGWLMPPCDRP